MVNFYIYYNIYIHRHIHTYIYIYLFINIKNSGKPETVHRYWPVFEIYRTGGQTGTASGTVLTSLLLNQSFRSRTNVSHLSMLQEFSFPLNAPHETEKLHSIRQCSNVDQTNLPKKWKDQSHLNSWPLNPEDFQPYSAIS